MKCLGVTTELQNTPGRAGYGKALLARLGDRLKTEYGRGFSRANLQDMRRFHDVFGIRQPVAGKSLSLAFPQPAAAESGERLLVDSHISGFPRAKRCFVRLINPHAVVQEKFG